MQQPQHYYLKSPGGWYQSAIVSLGDIVPLRPVLRHQEAGLYLYQDAVKFKQYFDKIGVKTRIIKQVKL